MALHYVRVLPNGSDEWIAFISFDRSIPARLAAELLRESGRFRGVEKISEYMIHQTEGVDAMIAAAIQVSGSWAPGEQERIRDAVKARWDTLYQNHDSERAKGRQQQARYKLARETLEDGFALIAEAMAAEENESIALHRAAQNVLPKKFARRVAAGERDPRKVLKLYAAEQIRLMISFPKDDCTPASRFKELAKEKSMTEREMFIEMLRVYEESLKES